MMIIVFLFVFAIGSSIIQGILNLLFGLFGRLFGHRATTSQQRYGDTRQSQQQTRQQSQSRQSTDNKKSGKIFDQSDGEYVDFEEIEE